jgi:hypothetical protein
MVVQSRPSDPSRENEYNQWYDETHIPELLKMSGFVGARRYRLSTTQCVPVDIESTPKYLALYQLDIADLDHVVDALVHGEERGTMHMSDVLQSDPLPVVLIYEELAEGSP